MRIIFMDVDGPMIPTRLHQPIGGLYKYPMFEDGKTLIWDSEFIEKLVPFCQEHAIQLVFNTTHNWTGPENMKRTAIMNGIPVDIIHPSIVTEFPDQIDVRSTAIERWIDANVTDFIQWVVVDDMPVSDDSLYQVQVELKDGVTADKFLEIVFKILHPDNKIFVRRNFEEELPQ